VIKLAPRQRLFNSIQALIALPGIAILMLATAGAASGQVAVPSWSATGSMKTARIGHTATLLKDGRVLVVGGRNGAGIFNSAELYDPSTGEWAPTGNLNIGRVAHTANLLSNGKVLVIGGDTNDNPPSFGITRTAELYDPDSGVWTLTGSLGTDRIGFTSTLLQNGKVLITGGLDLAFPVYSPLSSSELYDPVSGTWSDTGNLSVAREMHTASLLQNGKVLVVGGTDDDDFRNGFASAELYDPNTGAWRSTGSLNTGRCWHTATLLSNGKVSVAGGELGFGGRYTPTASSELYDPITEAWSSTGNLNTARELHTATLLPDGKILVAGGTDAYHSSNSAEVYDPATQAWTSVANLSFARFGHATTLLSGGNVLTLGGWSNSVGALNSAELYGSGVLATNSIDEAQFFVRQQYLDFLNREPDAEGLAFWTSEITSCGTDQACVEVKRINVSAAFFLSIEFQETGYLVYRMYKASYGNLLDGPVPIKLSEFLSDTREIGNGVIVNHDGWQQLLENSKQNFALEFSQRSQFTSRYPESLTPEQFVDQLYTNAGFIPSPEERAQAISEFGSGILPSDTAARSRALRRVAESRTFAQQEFNRAFVLMQYFGYLRRNPNDAPDTNFDGYDFWLNKLNQFNGDFAQAEMVKAFIDSAEYRRRFGQ